MIKIEYARAGHATVMEVPEAFSVGSNQAGTVFFALDGSGNMCAAVPERLLVRAWREG